MRLVFFATISQLSHVLGRRLSTRESNSLNVLELRELGRVPQSPKILDLDSERLALPIELHQPTNGDALAEQANRLLDSFSGDITHGLVIIQFVKDAELRRSVNVDDFQSTIKCRVLIVVAGLEHILDVHHESLVGHKLGSPRPSEFEHGEPVIHEASKTLRAFKRRVGEDRRRDCTLLEYFQAT